MHSVESWLLYNNISFNLAREIIHGSTEPLLSCSRINDWVPDRALHVQETVDTEHTVQGFIDQFIAHAFTKIFLSSELCKKALSSINFQIKQNKSNDFNENLPYALDRGICEKPLVSTRWGASAKDCIALAHETSHAIQFILSNHEQMPPLAREICAFLGELLLLEWTKENDVNLFGRLLTVWHDENSAYLGSDIELLKEALKDLNQSYDYRLNYPLARLGAIHIFETQTIEDIRKLFSSGKSAMALMPFEAIADLANTAENYLPAMPRHDPAYPALDAYRGLGAIALLDIDNWQGPSETRIEDYYANLLVHLHNRTAFVALRADRKPIGYTTWKHKAGNGDLFLTRQSAPFGDHLQLQKAVESHLGADHVMSYHDRSSRQEQRAW